MKKSEVSGVTKTSAVCIHCQKVTQGPCVKINVSRLRDHLVKCKKIPEEVRRLSMQSSQRVQKIMKLTDVMGNRMNRLNRKRTSYMFQMIFIFQLFYVLF